MVAFLLFVIVVALIFGRKAGATVLLAPVVRTVVVVSLILVVGYFDSFSSTPTRATYNTYEGRFTPAQDSIAAALLARTHPCNTSDGRPGVQRPVLMWTNEPASEDRRPFVSFWPCEALLNRSVRARAHRSP